MTCKISIAIEEQDACFATRELEAYLRRIGFVRVDDHSDRRLGRMYDVLRAAGIDYPELERRYESAVMASVANVTISAKEAD